MTCADYKTRLSAYLDAVLPVPERAQLEDHLSGCAGCRAELASLQRMVASLQKMELPEVPELLPAIHARLQREPGWRRFLERLTAPWPESLPLHALALATTVILVVVIANLPGVFVLRKMTLTQMLKDEEQGEVTHERRAFSRSLANDALLDSASIQGARMNNHPLSESEQMVVAHAPPGASLAGVTPPQLQADPSLRLGGASEVTSLRSYATTSSFEGGTARQFLKADVAPSAKPPVQYRWAVSDLKTAMTTVHQWISQHGGSVVTVHDRQLLVTLAVAELPAFLTQFPAHQVASPPSPMEAGLESATSQVTFSLELVPSE